MHIELYQMADGTEPVADFLQSLDKSMHAKAMHTIDLLEARGYLLRSPLFSQTVLSRRRRKHRP